MLKLTGHPLFDVGAAAVTVFSGKKDVEEVVLEDLDKIADFMKEQYLVNPLKSFLTAVFTSNASFLQPSFSSEKKAEQAQLIFSAYKGNVPALKQKCVFTGEPAIAISLSEEAIPGKAFRQHIPLASGVGVINFYPGGEVGLFVSGVALLCLHAFPLACAKCAGRLLIVHSENPAILLHFASEFLTTNRENISFAQAAGSSKLPESGYRQKTLLLDTLLKILDKMREEQADSLPFTVTAYHLSNSGQSPSLDIYHLPLGMITFLRKARGVNYRENWQLVERKAWQAESKSANKVNFFYEDLFGLPDNARKFLRTYFLRIPWKQAKKGDPRAEYSTLEEREMISWKLTALFLKEVMEMEKDAIEQIRKLGDKLASYVSESNDRRFFRNFFEEQRYDYFRTLLLKANRRQVVRGKKPLIEFEPYIEVFEEGEGLANKNWRLSRDLLLIRMIEKLFEDGWFGNNADVLIESEEEIESENK